jgi:hypothetical protein
MQTNVQEFYTQNVLPMNEQERLKLAALIIGDLSNGRETNGAKEQTEQKGDITKFFGMFDSGNPESANNEEIDRDLARAYGDNHEDEN